MRHARVESVCFELLDGEGAREEAALILAALDVDQHRAGEGGGREDHASTVTRGMGTTKRPPQLRMCAICSMTSGAMFQGRMST